VFVVILRIRTMFAKPESKDRYCIRSEEISRF
jgi:hypothetical protein